MSNWNRKFVGVCYKMCIPHGLQKDMAKFQKMKCNNNFKLRTKISNWHKYYCSKEQQIIKNSGNILKENGSIC